MRTDVPGGNKPLDRNTFIILCFNACDLFYSKLDNCFCTCWHSC